MVGLAKGYVDYLLANGLGFGTQLGAVAAMADRLRALSERRAKVATS